VLRAAGRDCIAEDTARQGTDSMRSLPLASRSSRGNRKSGTQRRDPLSSCRL
jgi:hypothetical protein